MTCDAEPEKVDINANMLEDFDLTSLSIEPFDGAALPPKYEAPQPPTRPEAKEGLVIYDGSCHCGAVTYTLQVEPFDRAKRCDCSICGRVGRVPLQHQSALLSQCIYHFYQFS